MLDENHPCRCDGLSRGDGSWRQVERPEVAAGGGQVFRIDRVGLDPPTATDHFDVHLTGRLQILDAARTVFEEEFVPIIDLAAQWRRWLDAGLEAGEDFVYADDAFQLGELFRLTRQPDARWRVSSVHEPGLALDVPIGELVAAVESALASIRAATVTVLGAGRAGPWLS